MNQIKSYTTRLLILLFLSGFLIYLGLIFTFHYVNDNFKENRNESIQFIANEVHDKVIELNLMANIIKLQQFLTEYSASNEVNIYKIHVLNKNYAVIASTDIHYIQKNLYDENYRQAKERSRSYIIEKKVNNEQIIECAYPIKNSRFLTPATFNESGNTDEEVLGIILIWRQLPPFSDIIYSEYPNWLVSFILLLILFIIIFIGIYTNRFFARLGNIAGTAQKIALGDYKERFRPDDTSEITLLAESFNQIADNLESRIKETSDINKKLEESNKEKEKQVNILSQMAGGVAHEVRNPLGGIRGFAELLKAEIPPDDKTKLKYIDYILNEVKSLEVLVQNVLDFARPRKPNISKIYFELIIDTVINILQPRIDEIEKTSGLKINFNYKISDNAAYAFCDFNQMRQVILNLALNACDALSETGGSLNIFFEKIENESLKNDYQIENVDFDEYIKISICDTGHGMTSETLENLFAPFFTTKASGTGLGLSICKKIIENHKGCIKIKSEINKGTSFFIFLPLISENCN
ncbi:MAG: ATP-binding protein [Candidatus Wallbacteria bacterium]